MNYSNQTIEQLNHIIKNLTTEANYFEQKRDTRAMMQAIAERKKVKDELATR